MLVPVADYLVCDHALAPVPVVVVQGAVDKCCKENKGTDAIDDFHGVLLFRGTLWLGEGY
jgi:hypothetical protein